MLASEFINLIEVAIKRNGDLDLKVTDEFNTSEPFVTIRAPHGKGAKRKILIGFTPRTETKKSKT